MNDYVNTVELLLGRMFAGAGHELYLVGGAIRDQLLGLPVTELDFATSARPDETVGLLQLLENRSLHRVGEKFGTIGVVIDGVSAEITTYRSAERYAPGSRKPLVQFGASIDEDLSRRDFTINAIARVVSTGTTEADGNLAVDRSDGLIAAEVSKKGAKQWATENVIDPFGGLRDLDQRVIRAVGTAEDRFREDPLRLLRGVRFAAQLSFEIEPATWLAMVGSAKLLRNVSRERVAEEMGRMLTGLDAARAMTLLRDSGLLAIAVPRLCALDAMADHGPRHRLSLWEHTMRVVMGVPTDPITRWAALLHDIAKPETRTFDSNGRIRFPRHDEIGAMTAVEVLESLRMSKEITADVRDLVETHMQIHQYTGEWSDGAVRRLSQKLGENLDRALDLARADARGHGDTSWGIGKVEALAERVKTLDAAVPEVRSPLDGRELMEHFDREPGPWIGEVKDRLTEMVLEGELAVDDKPAAWTLADRIAAESKQ